MSEKFRDAIAAIARKYNPAEHPLWYALRMAPRTPVQLGALYNIYQSAMHATRAEVYKLPFLDTLPLRRVKLDILMDDDLLPVDGSHHVQLAKLFRALGAVGMMGDNEFGALGWETVTMETSTGTFINLVEHFYPLSLGPWCIIERLSNDWLGPLYRGLGEPVGAYFDGVYAVEDRHAGVALDTTCEVLRTRPALEPEFAYAAEQIAHALVGVWDDMLEVIR